MNFTRKWSNFGTFLSEKYPPETRIICTHTFRDTKSSCSVSISLPQPKIRKMTDILVCSFPKNHGIGMEPKLQSRSQSSLFPKQLGAVLPVEVVPPELDG